MRRYQRSDNLHLISEVDSEKSQLTPQICSYVIQSNILTILQAKLKQISKLDLGGRLCKQKSIDIQAQFIQNHLSLIGSQPISSLRQYGHLLKSDPIRLIQFEGCQKFIRLEAPRCGWEQYNQNHRHDFLFWQFVKKMATHSMDGNNICVIQDPLTSNNMTLPYSIAAQPQFFTQKWHNLFVKAENIFEHMPEYSRKAQGQKQRLGLNKRLQYEDLSCLGCHRHFVINRNIYSPSQIKHKLALVGSIKQLMLKRSIIKVQICGLLNNKGGVILFDTERYSFKVIPRGTYINQEEKQDIEAQIKATIKEIKPVPVFGSQIILDFVPLSQPDCHQGGFSLIEGSFVVRVIVKPTGNRTYLWTMNNLYMHSIRWKSLFEGNDFTTSRTVDSKEINSRVKDEIESLSQEENFYLSQNYSDINHQCPKPFEREEFKSKANQIPKIQQKQVNFPNAALTVIKPKSKAELKQKLKRYGINCQVDIPFENLTIKGASCAAILYYDIEFTQMLELVFNNKEFQFDGKSFILIRLTNYVKLLNLNQRNKMAPSDLKGLQSWLKEYCPKEELKLFQLILPDRKEYFMKTESKVSRLLIFLVLNHFGQKAIFKEPKLENEPLAGYSTFRMVYPRCCEERQ